MTEKNTLPRKGWSSRSKNSQGSHYYGGGAHCDHFISAAVCCDGTFEKNNKELPQMDIAIYQT
jgi:hypothetical protein